MLTNKTYKGVFYFCISLIFGCTASKSTTSNAQFSEDLSVYRVQHNSIPIKEKINNIKLEKPKKEFILPKRNINQKLDDKLLTIAKKNQEIISKPGFKLQGFKVQVFSGGSRRAAEKIQLDLIEKFEEERKENNTERIEVKLEYEQPNYKVKVGKYFAKLEAYKMKVDLKAQYPLAIVVPEKIRVNFKELKN